MKLAHIIKYSFLKTFRDKRNILYIILLIICSITIFGALIFKTIFVKMIDKSYNEDIAYRNIIIRPNNEELDKHWSDYNFEDWGYDKVKDIPHVIGYHKFNFNNFIAHESSFKNDFLTGTIVFLYGAKYNLPEVIKGESFEEDAEGVAICEKYLRPNFLDDPSIKGINKIDKKTGYINMEDYIGKSFTIYKDLYSPNADGYYEKSGVYEKSFKVIGVTESIGTESIHLNCYISPKDIETLHEETAFKKKDNNSWSDYALVSVDNKDNIGEVSKQIAKLGFKVKPQVEFDYYIEDIISNICNIIVVVSISGVMIISILYAWKKIVKDIKDIALLKSLGCKNKDIIILNLARQMIISLFAFIIAWLLVEITIILLNYKFANVMFFYNLKIERSIFPYLCSILILLGIPTLINYIMTKRLLRKDVFSLVRSK